MTPIIIGGHIRWNRFAGLSGYAAGFVIWLFGYLSAGHATAFDWDVYTPPWISSFVPNLEAEFGLALMFASMIPIYRRAHQAATPPSLSARPCQARP
jgi:hypothetical protein